MIPGIPGNLCFPGHGREDSSEPGDKAIARLLHGRIPEIRVWGRTDGDGENGVLSGSRGKLTDNGVRVGSTTNLPAPNGRWGITEAARGWRPLCFQAGESSKPVHHNCDGERNDTGPVEQRRHADQQAGEAKPLVLERERRARERRGGKEEVV